MKSVMNSVVVHFVMALFIHWSVVSYAKNSPWIGAFLDSWIGLKNKKEDSSEMSSDSSSVKNKSLLFSIVAQKYSHQSPRTKTLNPNIIQWTNSYL